MAVSLVSTQFIPMRGFVKAGVDAAARVALA